MFFMAVLKVRANVELPPLDLEWKETDKIS